MEKIYKAIDFFTKYIGLSVEKVGVGFATIAIIGRNFKLKFYALGLEEEEIAALIEQAAKSKGMRTIRKIIEAGVEVCFEYQRVGWVLCES